VQPQGQGRVAFLPFIRISLKSLIPSTFDFEPKTLGEHIRRRRLILVITQKEAAKVMGVNSYTLGNWEKGPTAPHSVSTGPGCLSRITNPIRPQKRLQSLLDWSQDPGRWAGPKKKRRTTWVFIGPPGRIGNLGAPF